MAKALIIILGFFLLLYCLYLLMGMGFIWTVAVIFCLILPALQVRAPKGRI